MFRDRFRASLTNIGQALREPEGFALRWHREGTPYAWWVFAALALTAIAGTTSYGMVMGLFSGASEMFLDGLRCTTAAGIAWSLPLPALYILNSLTGSRLRASTTFLAALVTCSWGGLALIASIPITWFFTWAIPHATFLLAVNLVVFSRVMEKLEPSRGRIPAFWLTLVGAIGGELFYAFRLFDFASIA
jgi:hypothetical protein